MIPRHPASLYAIFEMDAKIRELQNKAVNDPSVEPHYAAAMKRAGLHADYLKPHVDKFNDAYDDHQKPSGRRWERQKKMAGAG